MIEYGAKEHIPQLKALWKTVFGDSEEYINAFFEGVYKEENVILFVEQKEVLAALYMIPYQITNRNYTMNAAGNLNRTYELYAAQGGEYSAVYLYALATKESARNKGIMKILLQESEKIARQRGYLYQFLIPSDEKIVKYYNRFHFQTSYCQTKGMFLEQELLEIKKSITEKDDKYFLIYQKETDAQVPFKNVLIMIKELEEYSNVGEIFIEKVLM